MRNSYWSLPFLLAAAVSMISGCASRACEEQPPSMEVELTLHSDVVVADIVRVRVGVSAAGQAKTSELDAELLKTNRRASFVVMVGDAGAGGFDVEVVVDLLASGGQVIASAHGALAASGNGCNSLSLRLEAGVYFSDGGVIDSTADSTSPDGGDDRDGTVDSCTPQCVGKLCGEDDGCGTDCATGSGCTSVVYAWVTGGWGACSVNCGGGTQTRSVTCQATPGGTVADSNCTGTKPATSQGCNPQDCCTGDALAEGRRCEEANLAEQWADMCSNTGSAADRDCCVDWCKARAQAYGESEWCCHMYEDSSPGTLWVCRVYWNQTLNSSSSVWAGLGRCQAP